MIKQLKTISITLLSAFFLIQPVHGFDSTDPFDFTALDTTNNIIQRFDTHNPVLSLFGSGFTTVTATEAETQFDNFYDFCKDHGDGTGLTTTGADMITARDNFVAIVDELQRDDPPNSLTAMNSLRIATDNPHIPTLNIFANNDGAGWTTAELIQLFDSWVEAHNCDTGYLYPLPSVGNGFTKTYVKVDSDDVTQVGSYDKYTDVSNRVRYKYCYTDEAKRNRDIILFLTTFNKTKLLAEMQATVSDVNYTSYEDLFVMLFMKHLTFNEAVSEPVTLQGMSNYIFNIRPVTFPLSITAAQDITDYEALMQTEALSKSGLGYACEQIRELHTNTENSANKGAVESCVKAHIAAIVADTPSHTDGICDNGNCGTVTSGTGATQIDVDEGLASGIQILTGFAEDDSYHIPSFAYCTNDDDFDGFIAQSGTYNWGTFDAATDVPFTSIDVCVANSAATTTVPAWRLDADGDGFGVDPSQTTCTQPSSDHVTETTLDQCPSNADLQAPQTWYEDSDSNGFGTPFVTTSSCSVAVTGFVLNSTDRAESLSFDISTSNGQVTVSRNVAVTDRIKTLQITSENGQIEVQGQLADDSTMLIHANTAALQASRTGGEITTYCLRVKGNLSSLTQEYMLIIPASGTNEGVIQSTYIVDTDPLTLKEISLNGTGSVVEGDTLVQATGAEPCDFTAQ